MSSERKEYQGHVLIWKVDTKTNLSRYSCARDIKTQSTSPQRAYNNIRRIAYQEFPGRQGHYVQVRQINLEGKVVYNSIEDESGSALVGIFP